MAFSSQVVTNSDAPMQSLRAGEVHRRAPLLSPPNAWRVLCRRTGGHVSRSTFYRWVESGKVFSLRFGSRIYIPWQALEEVIGRCLSGEPF